MAQVLELILKNLRKNLFKKTNYRQEAYASFLYFQLYTSSPKMAIDEEVLNPGDPLSDQGNHCWISFIGCIPASSDGI